VANKF